MPRNALLHVVTSGRDTPSAFVATDRYWDAVVRDEPLPDATIDPTLAATIHHLRDVDDAPLPDAAFAARLERELLRAASPIGVVPPQDYAELRSSSSPQRVELPRWPAIRRRTAMQVVAAAALVAMVVTSTLIALWAGTARVPDRNPVPLVLAPGITDEKLLLQARFDSVPDGVLSAVVRRWVLQPGAEVTMGRQDTSGSAAAAYLVETGSLTIHPDRAISVTRADATTPTAVPEASWMMLLPGDRMFIPAGVTSQWQNDGASPVRLLEATFASRDVQSQPAGVLQYPVISDGPTAKPDGPVVMTVIELTLLPEGALLATNVPGLAMLKVESGRLVAIDVDGYGTPLTPVELGQATRFLGSFPPGRVFRTGNDEPVRLLLVTVADANPLGAGT
jgi:hypothetical protein